MSLDGDKMKTLAEYREQFGYSCQFMANKLQISKTYYWQLEKGKRRITYQMALRLSKIFNITPDQLLYQDMENVLSKRN